MHYFGIKSLRGYLLRISIMLVLSISIPQASTSPSSVIANKVPVILQLRGGKAGDAAPKVFEPVHDGFKKFSEAVRSSLA